MFYICYLTVYFFQSLLIVSFFYWHINFKSLSLWIKILWNTINSRFMISNKLLWLFLHLNLLFLKVFFYFSPVYVQIIIIFFNFQCLMRRRSSIIMVDMCYDLSRRICHLKSIMSYMIWLGFLLLISGNRKVNYRKR